MFNKNDISVLNDIYANGYLDCEKDHRAEWEKAAWNKGCLCGALCVFVYSILFIVLPLIFINL
jgi:hypothetical protein